MDEIYARLEAKMRALIQQHIALQEAYTKLENTQVLLLNEKDQIINKHKHAVIHIEQMISNLKLVEHAS